jgi:lipoprotein-releasing system permease protein
VSVQGIDPARWPKDDILHAQMLVGALTACRPVNTTSCWGRGGQPPQGLHRRPGASHPDRRYPLYPFGRVPAQRLFTVSGIFGVGADVDSQVALIALGDAQRMLRLPADRWAASASGWTIPSPPTRW